MSSLQSLIYRSKLVESVHEIKCYLGSIKGETIFSTNNEDDLIYPRSAIKIFQALSFSNSGAINNYNLNQKQIALSCASHCGESFHIRELESWLKKIKINASNLKCGIHNPFDKKSSDRLLFSRKKPYQLHNNCAGKHLAMLSSCLVNNYSIKNYVNFNHPHQIKIREVFSKFTGNVIIKNNYGIDGCSAPQYAFSIKELKNALSNLFKSYHGNFEFSENIKVMIESIIKNPLYIGGSKNLDSNLIKISNNKIFCKGGAEGVFLFLHLKKGIFGILKVKDGNERVLPSAMYTLLKKFKIFNKEEIDKLKQWSKFYLYNHANVKIGNIKTVIE